MFFSVNSYPSIKLSVLIKAKRTQFDSMLLLGYIFRLLAVSYALAHRMGEQSAPSVWFTLCSATQETQAWLPETGLLLGQQGWNRAVTFLRRPQGTAFLTHSMSSDKGAWWGISGGLIAHFLRGKSEVTYLFSFLTESWAKIKPFVEQSQSL